MQPGDGRTWAAPKDELAASPISHDFGEGDLAFALRGRKWSLPFQYHIYSSGNESIAKSLHSVVAAESHFNAEFYADHEVKCNWPGQDVTAHIATGK